MIIKIRCLNIPRLNVLCTTVVEAKPVFRDHLS